ncbi:PIN_8 domain-containing protein [Vibrio chagasii]|nr:PIN_8 domain-containing protein [Vibrio chagasii]CAH6991786.1 PIN_8 domain-containing protein [Vibrio chagasii]CAH7019856.1 PIN_8 domain-containing protein [Vibrio chagasii]CAH7320482.1 PIN_8 domain-containing protein [Vibrio chagasii]CAH7328669.1 PIN_8 domain-containing protein [Vibrio chagasii]
MKNIFPGHFKVKNPDEIWSEAHFVLDANVLLNLYRYSDATRKELEHSINSVKGKVYITHQAAKEFLSNRLVVTSGQAKEYTSTITSINSLIKSLSSKDRHPFIDAEKFVALDEVLKTVVSDLELKQKSLLDKLADDEILDFIEEVFEGKTGTAYTEKQLISLVSEGEVRYDNNIPPGYKDGKKNNSDDPYRKYGDLIVWKQTIDYAKKVKKPIVFITDDKKEDWWLEQSGRRIGPRPELIEEFINESKQDFLMYTVDKFVQEAAEREHKEVSADVISELQSIMERFKEIELPEDLVLEESTPTIKVSQHSEVSNEYENQGTLKVTLSDDMKYATGTGRFKPRLKDKPDDLSIELVQYPSDGDEDFKYSYGCGTNNNFNVHLKAKGGVLLAGEYVFSYKAKCYEGVM